MARYDNAHSRVVAWLKLLLPLAALGILSTLFLIARTVDPTDAIPYADVDVEDLARDPRIGFPDYSGVTRDGSAINVTAEIAWPDLADRGGMSARVVRGVLETPGGGRFEMTSVTGVIDGDALRLDGDVVVITHTGYTLRSERMTAALDRTGLLADGPVTAVGPPGRLRADAMELGPAPSGDNRYVLVFNGDVKLVYDPEPGD